MGGITLHECWEDNSHIYFFHMERNVMEIVLCVFQIFSLFLLHRTLCATESLDRIIKKCRGGVLFYDYGAQRGDVKAKNKVLSC